MRGWIYFLILAITLLSGCAKQHFQALEPHPDLYIITSRNDRYNYRETTLKNEIPIITKRRIAASAPVGAPRVGLAMSGGGIRSNAFQLGLLSGLYEAGLLKYVDYISAVSGGSWAAGAYKSFPDEDKILFNYLDSISSKEEIAKFDNADDKYLFNTYSEATKRIRDSFFNIFKPTGYFGNDTWRYMLAKRCLETDPLMSDLDTLKNAVKRPFLIINSTHDGSIFSSNSKNFPMEITSKHIGTMADCGNTNYCGPFSEDYNSIFITGESWKNKRMRLSHAMSISGAVAPPQLKVLNTYFPLDVPGKENLTIREKFILTDGGQSENLGALPLAYRNLDFIVISDAAYDKKYSNEDLEDFKNQSKNLLGYEVKVDTPNNRDYITKGPYFDENNKAIGCVLYIKPPDIEHLDQFFNYLSQKNSFLYTNFIFHKEQLHFPMDRTLNLTYDANIIKAYYMLGKYIGASRLKEELDKYRELKSNYCSISIIPTQYIAPHPPPPPLTSPGPDNKTSTHEVKNTTEPEWSPSVNILNFSKIYEPTKPTVRNICDYVNNDLLLCYKIGKSKYKLLPKFTFLNKSWNKITENVDVNTLVENMLSALGEETSYLIEVVGHASDKPYNCKQIGLDIPNNVSITNYGNFLITVNNNQKIYKSLPCRSVGDVNHNGNTVLSYFRAAWFAEMINRKKANNISVIKIEGLGADNAHDGNSQQDRYIYLNVEALD